MCVDWHWKHVAPSEACRRLLAALEFTDGAVDPSKLRPADLRQFLASQLDARRTPSNASLYWPRGFRSYSLPEGLAAIISDGLTAIILSPGTLEAGDLAARSEGGGG